MLLRSWGISLLAVAFFVGHASAEEARTDDDDPMVNVQGVGVNRVLAVLRHVPDAASDSCLNAVGAMHKAQKQLEGIENNEDDPDIALVRDVLSSDMEDVVTMCGADAQTLCREKAGQDAGLAKLCAALPHDSSDDAQ
ncbi:hypothetical protein GS501_08410 [Saccharibacter sp. 17.LH.SD]|nr:hypothetical protein [Saccharibacter sp. 17.LH.SD]